MPPLGLELLAHPSNNPRHHQIFVSSAIAMTTGVLAAPQATKYLLRAGQIPKAEQTIAIFTRHEGDPQHNLFEMQCRCAVLCCLLCLSMYVLVVCITAAFAFVSPTSAAERCCCCCCRCFCLKRVDVHVLSPQRRVRSVAVWAGAKANYMLPVPSAAATSVFCFAAGSS